MGNFPGGPVAKNPPSNTGDAGSIPGRGTKIPRATGQLSPPQLLSPHATTREKPARYNEEPLRHNERSHVLQLRPDAAKNK